MKARLFGLASLCVSAALLVSFVSSKTQSQGSKSTGEDGLSQSEQDLLNEINQARVHPDVYAKYLSSLRPLFNGKIISQMDSRPYRLKKAGMQFETRLIF